MIRNLPQYAVAIKSALFAAALFISPIQAFAQAKCSVEIVLALDVSGSVDWKEFRLQRQGVAAAFKDEEVQELIAFLPGGIAATITHWSGAHDQQIIVNWHSIRNPSDADDFAQKLLDYKRSRSGALTAIGSALLHANKQLNSNPTPCHRRVIDVSSDGRNNRGPDPTLIAEKLAENGATINALVIGSSEDTVIGNVGDTLLTYFQKKIIRGPGSFAEFAIDYNDYARAIKEKLLQELAPAVADFEDPQTNGTRFAWNEEQ